MQKRGIAVSSIKGEIDPAVHVHYFIKIPSNKGWVHMLGWCARVVRPPTIAINPSLNVRWNTTIAAKV